jgi:hypothetical protein
MSQLSTEALEPGSKLLGALAPPQTASGDDVADPASNAILDMSLSIPEGLNPFAAAQTSALTPRGGRDEKVEYLDGVRGIMCLVVVCDHWLMMGYYSRLGRSPQDRDEEQLKSPFFEYPLTRSPLRIFVAGEFAVATFFVLRCGSLLISLRSPFYFVLR